MIHDTASSFLSLSLTDRVISRNLQSCMRKAGTVTPSTLAYFIRYALYTTEFLESRIDATEKSWFPLLTKYDHDLSKRSEEHRHLRQTSLRARETLERVKSSKNANLGEDVPKVLAELWEELKQVFDTDRALLDKVGSKVSSEDMDRIEQEEKSRRLGMMKKDGHLWCATYLMRSLTAKEREQFPPGVPNMAKSAMMMAGNWQFSRSVAAISGM